MNTNFNTAHTKIISSFNGTNDLVVKEIKTERINAYIYYLDGMINLEELELTLIRPLISYKKFFNKNITGLNGIIFTSCNQKEISDIDEAVNTVAAGDVVLFMDGAENFITFAMRKANSRSVAEPPTSSVIKGPREGFTEDIKTNMILIRRRLRSTKLVFVPLEMGRYSETPIMLAYLKGIAKQGIIDKIIERLQSLDIDGIVDSSYVTKMLESNPYSIFKQVGNSEKPDVIASKLLDGRIAIIVDGSPIVLTVPFLLIEDFEDSQDHYKRSARVTFLRYIRIIATFFAVVLPAIFVALQIHQYQILPLQMLITTLNATGGIPFSPTVEMLIALILFEILAEASIRMPRHISMALSVVGAIVLGDTAVKAGLLSSITVLIVALSGIGIYAVPNEVGAMSQIRFLLVCIAGILGLFGILTTALLIAAYLGGLNTFSVPYLSPLAPIQDKDLQNVLSKLNLVDEEYRTQALRLHNNVRLKNNLPK